MFLGAQSFPLINIRFLYTQFSDKLSDEIRVEIADWARVKALLAEWKATVHRLQYTDLESGEVRTSPRDATE